MPLAAWGVFFYGSLLALLAPALVIRKDETSDPGVSLTFFLATLAVAIDVVLFGLQAAVIKAFCQFCIATYAVNFLLLAALWPLPAFWRGLELPLRAGLQARARGLDGDEPLHRRSCRRG